MGMVAHGRQEGRRKEDERHCLCVTAGHGQWKAVACTREGKLDACREAGRQAFM